LNAGLKCTDMCTWGQITFLRMKIPDVSDDEDAED